MMNPIKLVGVWIGISVFVILGLLLSVLSRLGVQETVVTVILFALVGFFIGYIVSATINYLSAKNVILGFIFMALTLPIIYIISTFSVHGSAPIDRTMFLITSSILLPIAFGLGVIIQAIIRRMLK